MFTGAKPPASAGTANPAAGTALLVRQAVAVTVQPVGVAGRGRDRAVHLVAVYVAAAGRRPTSTTGLQHLPAMRLRVVAAVGWEPEAALIIA